METLARLKEQGKIRHVALSNVTLEHIQRAQKIVPIVSVQNRYSFSDREWDFVLDYCEANDIAFLPWGPMAQARKANEVVEKIAAAAPRLHCRRLAGLAAAPLAGHAAHPGNQQRQAP